MKGEIKQKNSDNLVKSTKSNTDLSSSIKNKILHYQEVIRKTILSTRDYKRYELISASELNICIQGLNNLYSQLQKLLQQFTSETNYDNILKDLQNVVNELSTLMKTFGTFNMQDLIEICFGIDYLKSVLTPQNNEKYKLLQKYFHPTGYNVMIWKADKTGINKKEINKSRIVDDITIVDCAETFDCFDLSRTNTGFYSKIYGIKIALQNVSARKTLIIWGLVDDIMLDCMNSDLISNVITKLKDNKPSDKEFHNISYDRYIDGLSIKDLLVYTTEELNNKYIGYIKNVYTIKQKPINQIVNEFMNEELYMKRLTLIQLLLKSNEYEYQYLAYLLYDLLSNDENNTNDTREQIVLFDSLTWNVKKHFRDAMKHTIQYTNGLANFDNNKIPLEQQICLMKVDDSVKEKAMVKLKEVQAKSEDSGSKARQYLEGLLKIPFGIYRKEDILKTMGDIEAKFKTLLKNICEYSTIDEIPIKEKYTNIEVYKYNNIIKEKYMLTIHNNILSTIKKNLVKNKKSDAIQCVMFMNGLIKNQKLKNIKINHSGRKLSDINKQLVNCIDHFSNNERCINELTKFVLNQEIENNYTTLNNEINEINELWVKSKSYMDDVNETLNQSVHGHDKAKRQIERIIGQWINGEQTGYCFGFEGPPGVGKTSLAKKGLANCLKDDDGSSRPFAFIALGGSSNGSTLDGHNYTYVGSTWGRIVDILMDKKCMNPIIFIDELDKVSKTEHGKELIGILTHLIDQTQNDTFQDKYFNGVDLDLSKALFIFSYNDVELLDRILLDRIHRVKFNHLTVDDKIVITNKYIIPEITEKMGLVDMISLSDDVIKYIIDQYTCESGVRKLKEILFEIIGEINLKFLKNTCEYSLPISITTDEVKYQYLKERHPYLPKKIHTEDSVGIINGLWANSAGQGGIISIEANYFPCGTLLDLKLTGMQGDVMKESMNVAKTLAWKMTPKDTQDTLTKQFTDSKHQGLHIHCPEGAVPKDGPSAGTAITTVLHSLFNNKKIRNDVAITGEINLQGRVTIIGGLDLKILGGIRAGVKTFLFPKENEKDFNEFMEKYESKSLVEGIKFIPVNTIREVMEIVYV